MQALYDREKLAIIDSDGDGISDYDERCYDFFCNDYDPFDPETNSGGADLNIASRDTDGDGVDDGSELLDKTDPLDAQQFMFPPATVTLLPPAAMLLLWVALLIARRRSLKPS